MLYNHTGLVINETVTYSIVMESISKTSYFHGRTGVNIKT